MTNHDDYILFAAPFTCSLAVHIALRQRGLPVSIRWVSRGPGRLVPDDELARVNPKRKVATLVLPSGEVLTENAGILLYLDETHGPSRDAAVRRRLIEWLTYLGTELHKQVLAPVFDRETGDVQRQDARDRLLPPVLDHLAEELAESATLLGGSEPSPADAYLFWGLLLLRHRWPEDVQHPALTGFLERMQGIPYVREVLSIEAQQRAASAA
ncbi:MAG: glutathione S-transferase N-terminal domain-containing protein [Deltaproteobacteria bacterium]|nr:glutathione S-transferase N-terminal domain-containing protein [Deltaproteobacteria bacterium]